MEKLAKRKRAGKTNEGKNYRKACPVCHGKVSTTRRKAHLIGHVAKAREKLTTISRELSAALNALRIVG